MGSVGALRALYEKTAVLALCSSDECKAGGREQHILSAAAYGLAQLHESQVCQLHNDANRQRAAFNMGTNNKKNFAALVLNETSGYVEAPRGGGPIAILHQFDRRPAVNAFIDKHLLHKRLGLGA